MYWSDEQVISEGSGWEGHEGVMRCRFHSDNIYMSWCILIILSSIGDGVLRETVVGCFSSPLLASVLRPVLLAALPSFAQSRQL